MEAKLGLRLPGKVEILEGIRAGDSVVTAGHGRLMRGESIPVRVIDINKPMGGGKPSGGPGALPGGGGSGASGASGASGVSGISSASPASGAASLRPASLQP